MLRLLLCLCLLVDTLGPAVAATHLAMADAGTPVAGGAGPVAGDSAARPAAADCHSMRDPSGMTPAPVAPAAGRECLERCLELCLQHGIAALPATPSLADYPIAWLPAPVADAQVAAVHAGPLLRPPIA